MTYVEKNNRLEYIDIIKGITILWVVWMHMDLPSIIYPAVQMPVFFFISGCFFKKREFKEFIIRKTNTLLVPLIFFWLTCYIYYVFKNELIPINFNFNQINWSNILDITGKYSYGNISILWFLVGLFCIDVIWFFVNKYSLQYVYLILSFLLYPVGAYLYATKQYYIIPLIPVSHILLFQPYFVIGAIIGKKILNICEHNKITIKEYVLFAICIIAIPVIQHINWGIIPFTAYIFPYSIAFIIISFKLCHILCKYNIMKIFQFYGINSLIVYCTHWQLYKWIYIENKYIHFLFICSIEIFIIILFNKYIPFFVGKKPLIK